MAELFSQLLDWVNAHPGWAGVVVFLMAFAESLALVGMVVPGVAILFAVGALIGAGALDFWAMTAWAVAGAVLGDGLSYWLGRRYRHQLTRLWPFSRHPATLERGIAFFEKYGGKSVAIGRFFGPVRAVIPLVAGMLAMPPGRFLAANLLSALAWAPAYLLPGMVFGASLELASEVALRLVGLLVVLVASLWFLGWLSHRLFVWLQPVSRRLVRKVLSLGERIPALRQIAGALGDPNHPEARGLAMLAGLLTLASSLLVAIALVPTGPLRLADTALHLGLDQLHNSAGNHLMLALSAMAGSAATLATGLGLWLLFIGFGLRQAARHWLLGSLAVWLLTLALEGFLRGHPNLLGLFPDTYVLRATTTFGLAAVLAATPVPQPHRWLVYSGATLLVMAVVLAQLYLGSTLLAVLHALTGGLIWITALGMAYRTHGRKERFRPFQGVALSSLVLVVALAGALATPAPPARPELPALQGLMSRSQWWNGGWQALPRARSDVLEKAAHPLNFQYAGSLATLRRALEEDGWRQVRPAPGLAWLRLLNPATPLAEMPVLPHSHAGKLASHTWVRNDSQGRIALYLWPSGYYLEENGRPIWLGEVTPQKKKRWLGLLAYPVSSGEKDEALERLAATLQKGGLVLRREAQGRLLLAKP